MILFERVGQGLWDVNLAYSLTIGLISWLSIDRLRLRWRESDDIPWPRGMRGMAVVPLGIAAGLILGNPLGSLYVQQLHPELPATARPSLWLPFAITLATSIAMSWGFYVVGKSRHLQMLAEQAQRQAAVQQAEVIIDTGVQSFMQWMDQRKPVGGSVSLIQQVNAQADEWRALEIARAKKLLAKGEDIDTVLEALSRGLTQKMLHGTMAELHKGDAEERAQTADTVSRLFLRASRNPSKL